MPPLTITLLHTSDDCRTPYFPTFIPRTPASNPHIPPLFLGFPLSFFFCFRPYLSNNQFAHCTFFFILFYNCAAAGAFLKMGTLMIHFWRRTVLLVCADFLFYTYFVADWVLIQQNQSCKNYTNYTNIISDLFAPYVWPILQNSSWWGGHYSQL